jgi:uncharacterized membrane protein
MEAIADARHVAFSLSRRARRLAAAERRAQMSKLSQEFIFAGTSAGAIQSPVRTITATPVGENGVKIMRRAPYIMLVLAFIGIAVASYDAYAIYNGQLLWCPPPVDGCNEVAASPYARIFNLPVGYYGVVYYLYMFGLAALLAFDPLSRGLRVGAVLYAVLGVLFSIYFMILQLGFIHAFCIYCLVSAVTTVLLAVAAISHWKATRMPAVVTNTAR